MNESELFNDNIKLVSHTMMKLRINNYDRNDIFQEGCIGLVKAIRGFDPSKGFKFSTYASRCIYNQILMYFRKEKKHQYCLYLQQPLADQSDENLTYLDVISNGEDTQSDVLASELIRYTQNFKKTNRAPRKMKQEEMILDLSLKGYTQKEILPYVGNISQPHVSRVLIRIRKQIKENWL